MFKAVKEYMEEHKMVSEKDTIVAGVSGGADSVCLFLLLEEYCRQKDARLVVVHLNHGIREEAVQDAEYVKGLCEEFDIPFRLFEEDINKLAKEAGIGAEEAGRIARYRAFEQVLNEYGGKGKIAVAHNKGDQAETVMFHLLRGSGIAGLTGIAPVRGNIIRPLLDTTREEIEAYLLEKGRKWCIDSTNGENTYTRNKLRNVVFPYVEKEICPQAVSHVANAANDLAQIKSFLDDMTMDAIREMVTFKDWEADIQVEPFLARHEVIQKQVILKVLEFLVPARRDIGSVHIMDVLSLFTKENGKQIQLPYGFVATKVYEQVVIKREMAGSKAFSYPVKVPGKICPKADMCINFTVFERDNLAEIPRKPYTKWFDCDKIISCLELRNRRTGDYLTITEDGKKKSVKEYFIEEKIPREERDDVPLLTDGEHVLWVIGKRISEYYKVTEQTKTILQVTVLVESE